MFEIAKTGLTAPPCLKIAFMPRVGTPELIIILVMGIFCVARSLVTAWLVTFLFLSHIYATL